MTAGCRTRTLEVWDTKSPADRMPTHKLTELSRIKQNLNSLTRPYDEQVFSHLTSLQLAFATSSCDIHECCCDFNAVVQARDFQSKGNKLSSSECRIRTLEVWDTKSRADWMPIHKPTELSRIKQTLNSIASPYDERAFSPLDFTAGWLSHLALAIYMFVVVNVDALLWHRQAIFESKGDNLSSSVECRVRTWDVWYTQSPADWMLTHKRTELSKIKQNLNSITRPYGERTLGQLDFTAGWLSHLDLAIYMYVAVNFDALAQASDSNAGSRKSGSLRHHIANRLNAHSQNDWVIEDLEIWPLRNLKIL